MFFGETKEDARKIIDALTTDDATRGFCTWWPEKSQLEIYYEYTGCLDRDNTASSWVWLSETCGSDVAGSVYIWFDEKNDVWRMSGRYAIDGEITDCNVLTFPTLERSICNAFVAYPVPEYVRAAINGAIARC